MGCSTDLLESEGRFDIKTPLSFHSLTRVGKSSVKRCHVHRLAERHNRHVANVTPHANTKPKLAVPRLIFQCMYVDEILSVVLPSFARLLANFARLIFV